MLQDATLRAQAAILCLQAKGSALCPPRITLMTNSTLQGDMRETFKSFHEDDHKARHLSLASPMSFAPPPARHGTAAVTAAAVTGPTAHDPPTPRPGRSRASCRHLSSQTSLPRLPSTFTKSTRRARVGSRTASGVLA